jgi:hypothetical protein
VHHSDVIIADIRIWELNAPAPAGFSLDDPRGETMNGVHF